MSDPVATAKREIRARLTAATPQIREGMRRLLNTPVGELNLPWDAAEFEVDPVFYGVVSIPLEESIVSELVPDVIPYDVFSGADECGINIDAVLGDVVMEWLAETWQEVGGHQFPYPAQGFSHGYARRYDFTTRQWVTG
jgi:hypothetical protein